MYALISLLLSPFYLIALYWRGNGGVLAHRLGILPRFSQKTIWLHGASLGEVASLYALIEQLRAQAPNTPLVITTNTAPGYRYIQKQYPFATAAYIPLDNPLCVGLALRRIKPDQLIVTEAERWLCLFRKARQHGAQVIAYNARLRGKTLYSKVKRAIYTHVYRYCNEILSQNPAPFLQLGLPSSVRISSMGSPKAAAVALKRKTYGDAKLHTTIPVLLVGSVHQDELSVYLDLFAQLRTMGRNAHLVLVPRHLTWSEALQAKVSNLEPHARHYDERKGNTPQMVSDSIAEQLTRSGITTVSVMGALYDLYQHATIFYLGGTFNPIGGHNVLEPAAWELPILTGPTISDTNYEALALERAGGLQRAYHTDQLTELTVNLLKNRAQCSGIGHNNAAWVFAQAAQRNESASHGRQ